MKINFNYILAILAIIIILTTKKEKFVEVMGFAGITKDTSDIVIADNIGKVDETKYTKQEKYSITPDITNDIVKLIQKYINSKYGICVHPIETNYINKYTNKTDILYKSRMIFMKSAGFPYAFSVSSDVFLAGGDSPAVLAGIYTQQTVDYTMEFIQPYENDMALDFGNFQDILSSNIPKING